MTTDRCRGDVRSDRNNSSAAARAQVSLEVIPILGVIDYSLVSFEDTAESLISLAADLAG